LLGFPRPTDGIDRAAYLRLQKWPLRARYAWRWPGRGLSDYAAAPGLPHPEAELAMLDEELITAPLYLNILDGLRWVCDQVARIAVASSQTLPNAAR